MNCFVVLGLEASATLEEVKQAFRSKARLLHPDLGGDAAEFEKVQQAYLEAQREVLGRKCAECNGTRRVTRTVGFNSIQVPCSTCG